MLIDLEGHGREELFADVDLSRTVGWFTSLFPVRLDAGRTRSRRGAGGRAGARPRAQGDQGAAAGAAGPRARLRAAALSQPRDRVAARRRFAPPQIGFNYLGRFAAAAVGGLGAERPEAAALGSGGDPAMPLAHALEVNALTLDAAGGTDADGHLVVGAGAAVGRRRCATWRSAGSGRWRRWCAMRRNPGPAAARPSDLPLVALSQGEIERLERRYPQIEDILPLSPLQEGLLFHALYDAQAPDVYTVQLVLALRGRARRRGAAGGRAGAARAPCQPAGRLPAREPEPAGADHRAARGGALAPASICRRWMRRAASSAWPASWPQDRAERFDLARAAAAALHADPARGRRASAGADQPSHPDGRLVDAGAGAGAAHALRAQGRCRGAAAGDALPRLSGVDRRRRTAPPRCRPGGRPWRGWRRRTRVAPPDRGAVAGCARADHAVAERAR